MKKTIIISAIIVVILGLILMRDYNNYFYGRSLINYHILPYELTPFHYKDRYHIVNGKKVYMERFYLINEHSETTGPGRSIPTASYNPSFVIDTIKSYYFNRDSIFVFCVDEENKPHWIIPYYDDGYVVFKEIKNVQMESLSKYRCVSNFYDEKSPLKK